jgi:NADH:ubiquinone reductase (H+-translocating)
MKQIDTLPHVVIVGAGFAGLRAARALADISVRVTLVDRNNYHLFQPLLYQVATAGLSPDEIVQPVRAILGAQTNLDFRMAEVRGVNLQARQLDTSHGILPYDFLILAAGGATNTFEMKDVERHAYGLKTLEDAFALRNHLLRLFEQAAQESNPARRQELLTFVIAGGGPTGVESAGAVAELAQVILGKDFAGKVLERPHILLLEAAERLLPALPERLARFTTETLGNKGVEVRFGTAVAGYDGKMIRLKDGNTLLARTLVWAAGVQAAPVYATLPVERGSLGRIRVLSTLQLPEHPEVFVLGDAALVAGADGRPLPMLAPVAMQQGEHAARNLVHTLENRPLLPFRYRDPGSMATIGRNRAVAKLGKIELRGLIAWLAWVVVHIFQLIGFRNRMMVLLDWAWSYLVFDRAVRVIGPERKAPTHPFAGEES